MKFSCSQEWVAKALAIVGRSVSARSTLPVLGNVLIVCEKDGLYFAATNLSVIARVYVPANIYDAGGITLPARLLHDVIGNLPPERVDIELVERTQSAVVECGKFTTTIKGIDYRDFPNVPDWQGNVVSFDGELLARLIEQVSISASSDESRPTLTGIEIEAVDGELKMAATDGFRLALCQVTRHVEIEKFIIPKKSLLEVSRVAGLVKPDEIEMVLTKDKNQVGFRMHNDMCSVELYCSLIDANFPNYRAIVPQGHNTRLICDLAELRRVVNVSMIFAKDNANIIRFCVDAEKGTVNVKATSDQSGDGISQLMAEIEGRSIEIALDGEMLKDVIGVLDYERVVIEMTQPTRPVRVTAASDDSFMYIQMPMQPK